MLIYSPFLVLTFFRPRPPPDSTDSYFLIGYNYALSVNWVLYTRHIQSVLKNSVVVPFEPFFFSSGLAWFRSLHARQATLTRKNKLFWLEGVMQRILWMKPPIEFASFRLTTSPVLWLWVWLQTPVEMFPRSFVPIARFQSPDRVSLTRPQFFSEERSPIDGCFFPYFPFH